MRQEGVAKKLNISRQTLNNYINGITLIDFEKLIELSRLVKRDIDYFYKTDYNTGNYLLRSDKKISNELKIKFEEKIRKYVEIEKIEKVKLHPLLLESYLNRFDRDYIQDISMKLRKIWNLSESEPIYNSIQLLEGNGVRVIQFDAMDSDVSGFSAYNEKTGYFIFLNTGTTIERQFFTSIHELAHFIFNKSDYDSELNIEYSELKENIADEIAGHFLLPTQAIKKYISQNYLDNYLNKIRFEDILKMKSYFHVSALCMTKRLFKESIINEKNYNELRNKLENEIGKKKEPYGLNEENFIQNFRFNNLVMGAYKKQRITLSKVAELMEISVIEAGTKFNEWFSN